MNKIKKIMKTMDGNEAAAYVSYAFTEVAAIYPITPSSPMAELVDAWSAKGMKNVFGQRVRLIEMQSEAGAIGAVHGSLEAGALATSYTSSQGLLLMIPTMYRIAGQLHPGVLHVSSRTVGTHAFSIFGDHSDVMSCRQTGFAILSSGSVQEVMDLSGVAHLAAIKSSLPFLHFFDGFRTSHEVQKIDVLDYQDLAKLLDYKALQKFRKESLNPERPMMRSTVQNPEVFFQAREACNNYYLALPAVVEEYLNEINRLTGRTYGLFNYYGAPDAEQVIIAMGSVSGTIQETVDYLNSEGQKVGFVQVHLYRPFSMEHFLRVMPKTVKRIAVLDRTKEPGAIGEPLYEDICAVYAETSHRPELYAGRYGLSSKDTTPAQIVAVFENLLQKEPKNHFTIGIQDDVTNLSLSIGEELDIVPPGTISCKFWGLGSDGTVGANKNTIKIIGEHTNKYVQAYFEYDTKKSGGVTRSHLRFGKEPIRSNYLVKRADFVACHNPSYLGKYDIISDLKDGGTFLLNCSWSEEELAERLPAELKKYLADHRVRFYSIDATKAAHDLGLGHRINIVLQAAFFKLANVIPVEEAVQYMKETIQKTYAKHGDLVVRMNYGAVDKGLEELRQVLVPTEWSQSEPEPRIAEQLPEIIQKILIPTNAQEGDKLPVSIFSGREDGTMPLGTSAYEKRGIAFEVPDWQPEHCLQCNQCSYVCPHASIRPFLLNEKESEKAPVGFETRKAKGKGLEGYRYRIQVSVLDCNGCGSCAQVCPAKEKALIMTPLTNELGEAINWEYAVTVKEKKEVLTPITVKSSQFKKPLLEFSGACAGCGETPYIKLVTQLYGDRMYNANATGCTQAWGAAFPSVPYTVDDQGYGPAWSNSLFENNAEFSLGMCLAINQQRTHLQMKVEELVAETENARIQKALTDWLDCYLDANKTREASQSVIKALETIPLTGQAKKLAEEILSNSEFLVKKSMWMIGGDGWAYDIGFGGLDHVLATGEDVNIMVLDTEVYSNTGGQSSKATPQGAVAQFAASGKKTAKKDLGQMAMSLNNVYVASIAMGASQSQTLKAILEAESYPGPSLIIAYAPCIAHGIKAGMANSQIQMKHAVAAGYWHLYRFNPLLKKQGKNPFILDSKEPTEDFKTFLKRENRYSTLEKTFPNEAAVLFESASISAREKYASLKKRTEEI